MKICRVMRAGVLFLKILQSYARERKIKRVIRARVHSFGDPRGLCEGKANQKVCLILQV